MPVAHLTYHYEPEGWWAESPEYPEYSAFGDTLNEVRALAHEGLRFFADDATLPVVDPFLTETTTLTTTLATVNLIDPIFRGPVFRFLIYRSVLAGLLSHK